ncbi:hypothetical protein CAQU_04220 [Corynebacterium aquilae DSM 44791]|uniref:Uncharacterized protein n=2 Tax=Corynebacterium aquilae TaxID=203263 RepID=A0A1L7CF09_9CORY|nr:hypothetical protein CAQU_04220 [Corynebacterium aquilae DSM 44791]
MACVVLAAASAVFVWLAIVLNSVLSGTIPWLAYPAPTPFFWGSIAAVLLIRRPGVATLTGFATALIGFGATALFAALFIELVAFLGKNLLRQTDKELFGRPVLMWSLIAGATAGLSQGLSLFMVSTARETLDLNLILVGIAIKIALGVVYGALSFLVARKIFHSGVDPQGLAASSRAKRPA